MYVDGVNIGEPDDAALRDRREISADGIFIVVATISSDDGSVVADPEVIFRGVAFLEEADGLVEDLKDLVEDQLDDAAKAPANARTTWSRKTCTTRSASSSGSA